MTSRNTELTSLVVLFLCSSLLSVYFAFMQQPMLLITSAIMRLISLVSISRNSPSAAPPQKSQNVSLLENNILNYMKDENAHYAISLYGEWGSGKTWFCDNRLKYLLRQNGYSLCRISMFGAESPKEVSSRIVTALFYIDETGSSRGIRNIKRFTSRLLSSNSNLIKRISKVPASLDSSALLNLLPRKKCLIVLDDIERSPFFREHDNSFGLINDLCENQGRKVLLVTGLNYPNEQKNQLEKVVWKKYSYTPSPKELYEATLSGSMPSIPKCDFNIKKAVIDGIERSGSLSVRALIKARPSLITIASSNSLKNQTIDRSERERSLSKAIELAILVSANALPEVEESSSTLEKVLVMDQLEGYEYLQEALEPLANGESINKNEIDHALSKFIEEKHSRTELDVEIDNLLSRIASIREMDNGEALPLVVKLSNCIESGEIKPNRIKKVYTAWKMLRDIGFSENPSEQQLEVSFGKTIAANPLLARDALTQQYLIWVKAGESRDPFLDNLLQEANNLSEKQLKNSVDSLNNESGNNAASVTLELLEQYASGDKDYLIPASISAKSVARAFESGSGKTQSDLIGFFTQKYKERAYLYNEGAEESYRWLSEIVKALKDIRHMEKLDEWRRNDLIDTLSKIRNEIDRKREG